ncbi:MAG: hypothetical protein ACFFG0_00910 [Candidatus Thorarchaeota archaeon]
MRYYSENSNKGWVKETYEIAAKQVAKELSLLREIIMEENDNEKDNDSIN